MVMAQHLVTPCATLPVRGDQGARIDFEPECRIGGDIGGLSRIQNSRAGTEQQPANLPVRVSGGVGQNPVEQRT